MIIGKVLKNESIPIYGKGDNVRYWLNVEDNVEAIGLIVRKGRDGEIYNVASSDAKNNLQIATLILRALNKPFSLIAFVDDRLGHDAIYLMDTSKIERLGWKPRHSFENDACPLLGVAEMISKLSSISL